jgi:poly(3-hydroxybutyrate) depolymerase
LAPVWVATLLAIALLPARPACGVMGRGPDVRVTNEAEDAPLSRRTVLRRALRSDAQQEYLLYVPARSRPGSALVVAVHGVSRNAGEHVQLLSTYAEQHGAVLVVPVFTATRNDDYQRLGRSGRGVRSDAALDAIVAEVAQLTGARADKFYLFGFSGGAQFAHRYVMAHPERVAGAAVAAAGWYTFPDANTPYPYGIGTSAGLAGVRFDPDAFLRVPIAVFVGEDDVTQGNLRRNPDVDRQQGETRLARAQAWVSAMRAAAASRGLPPLVTLHPVPGIRHSFAQFMRDGDLGARVFAAFFTPVAGAPAGPARTHAVPAGGPQ